MLTQLYILILAIGAVQGIVMGIILWKKNVPNPHANRWLAILLFFMAYHLIIAALRQQEIIGVNHWTYYILLEYNWTYGPLVYLYIISFIDAGFRLKRKDWIHFLPLTLEILFSSWVKTQNFFWDGNTESLPWLGTESYILWMHTPFPYIVSSGLILFYTRKARRKMEQLKESGRPLTSKHENSLNWIQRFLWVYRSFAWTAVIFCCFDYFFLNYAFYPVYQYPFYIIMALFTYWLGVEGFARRNEAPYIRKKKNTSSLDQDTLQQVLNKIEYLMQDGFYLREDASLQSLAEAAGYKPYLISQVLNDLMHIKFNDYLNQHRVEEVKRLLQKPAYANYTLSAIGLEAGFQSKASFNRSFKKYTGISPSAYRDSLTQSAN